MTEVVDRNETVDSASSATQIDPHVIILFGATGDLAARKLLPGLLHLSISGLMPEYRIVGSSTSELSDEDFRHLARHACDQFAVGKISLLQWANFEKRLTFVSTRPAHRRWATRCTRRRSRSAATTSAGSTI